MRSRNPRQYAAPKFGSSLRRSKFPLPSQNRMLYIETKEFIRSWVFRPLELREAVRRRVVDLFCLAYFRFTSIVPLTFPQYLLFFFRPRVPSASCMQYIPIRASYNVIRDAEPIVPST